MYYTICRQFRGLLPPLTITSLTSRYYFSRLQSVFIPRCVQWAKQLRETYCRTTVNACFVLSPVGCISPASLNFGIKPGAFDCPSITPKVPPFVLYPFPTRTQCARGEDAWEMPAPLLPNFGTKPGAFVPVKNWNRIKSTIRRVG